MQVRSLHHASDHRVKLLARARDHYRRASILSDVEGQNVSTLAASSPPSPYVSSSVDSAATAPFPRCLSPSTTTTSHSPSLSMGGSSVSSNRSSVDTCITTPSPSPEKQHAVPASLPPAAPVQQAQKDQCPTVRPDSPTLGCLLPATPPYAHPVSVDLASGLDGDGERNNICFYHDDDDDDDEEESEQDHAKVDPFRRSRSLHRFAMALESLHRQINMVHIPAVDTVTETEASPSATADLESRIRRLRATGWVRKRFDPSRYEALTEEAMADLMN
ncbi:hypothetical protein GMORB2_6213 [Geosmithia morbida]|uniref:Uncharacterized protein n=1 Tax=Geosmithia morbida TaxID=1094350 RepID=A0A9P5D260_9HYPO|nr:uncharacterized protein GMORB2_6213 [Geosmithia morbida]KAF4123512.1 hypothetical protein GMORB2_6213 [Geosmithia morbida]